jgi:CRISPR/Cas system Type II protein with McrA/HNH and RuvC-like nuclease domain
MRRVNKPESSIILQDNLTYKVGGDNKNLANALCDEQHNICAYTETYLGRTDKKDIEHFNPTLKDTSDDSYQNWFLVKAQWNGEKASKWARYQPILKPTDEAFEDRIIYFEGEYLAASLNDQEAVNLIKLLKLDDEGLAFERRCYLENLKETLDLSKKTAQQYIDDLLMTRPSLLYFIRAIEEELGVKVNFDLVKTK